MMARNGVAWHGMARRACSPGGSGLLASGFMTSVGAERKRKRKEYLSLLRKILGAV